MGIFLTIWVSLETVFIKCVCISTPISGALERYSWAWKVQVLGAHHAIWMYIYIQGIRGKTIEAHIGGVKRPTLKLPESPWSIPPLY